MSKTLLPDEAIEPIRKLDGEIRAYHDKHTVPWGRNNEDLLASTFFLEYKDAMRGFRLRREPLVDTFVQNYPGSIQTARVLLGAAFDPADYPDSHRIRSKFSMSVDFKPVPNAGDFRISILREEMDELRKSVNARAEEAERDATSNVVRRLMSPLAEMVNRHNDPTADLGLKSCKSFVANVQEICDLIPAINITGDAKIEAARQTIMAGICTTDPEMLRDNESVRGDTARKAQEVLDTISEFFPQAVAA